MATTNIGLLKTATSDTLGTAFTDFNTNMDTLDTKIGAIGQNTVKGLIDGVSNTTTQLFRDYITVDESEDEVGLVITVP